ncbi:MAG: four-carbon acid sugar kinase family protein [Limnochordaceae bacterium]|nr:four-carbon acid sugar kinase family protein [Limnochordaceae bacterium]
MIDNGSRPHHHHRDASGGLPPFGVVVADDLTGANATGVLLARQGLRALSVIDPGPEALRWAMDWIDRGPRPGVLLFNTASRSIEPAVAAARVRRTLAPVIEHRTPVPIVAKRIDSTARGNLGAEVAAALDVLGPESFAVVTAAYPASGRTVVGGYLLVEGTPVTRTGAAHDPLAPVRCSHLPTLLQHQQPGEVAHVPLGKVMEGARAVGSAIVDALSAGQRTIVADAVSDEDIGVLADATVHVVTQLHLRAVCADPGPLTAAALARLLPVTAPSETPRAVGEVAAALEPRAPSSPVLVVAGSTTELTRRQLARLERELGVSLVVADAALLSCDVTSKRSQEIQRLARHLAEGGHHPVRGIRTIGDDAHALLQLPPRQQARLLEAVGEAVRQATEAIVRREGRPPAGLYLSGGDVTAAVVRALGAVAIELVDQVLPLAALGRLAGGPFSGVRVVSKGGLVGGEDAAVSCVQRLMSP